MSEAEIETDDPVIAARKWLDQTGVPSVSSSIRLVRWLASEVEKLRESQSIESHARTGQREWTRTADDTHVDWQALREHCEWLSQADMTDSEEDFNRRWDAFYDVVTPDLILDLTERDWE